MKNNKLVNLAILVSILAIILSAGFRAFGMRNHTRFVTEKVVENSSNTTSLVGKKTTNQANNKPEKTKSRNIFKNPSYAVYSNMKKIKISDLLKNGNKGNILNSFSKEVRKNIAFSNLPQKNKDTYIIPMKLSSPSICNIGDLDIIRNELSKSNDRKLLLTIENLETTTSKKPIFIKELNEYDFLLKSKLEIELPIQNKDGIFGLFVCGKDNANDDRIKRCSDKSIKSMAVTLKKEDFKNTENYEPKVYYFSPLVLTKSGAIIPGKENFTKSESTIKEMVKLVSAKESSSIERKIIKLANNTGSIQPLGPYGIFKIDLPHLNLKKCERR